MTELMDGLHLHEEAVSAEMQADLLAFVEAQLSDGRHGTGALTAKTYTAPPDTWIASGQARHPTPCQPTLRHPTPCRPTLRQPAARLPRPVLRPDLSPFLSPA